MRVWMLIGAAVLASCGGGGGGEVAGTTPATVPAPTQLLCGVQAGTQQLIGTVVNVHDGDTVTVQPVGGERRAVRLDSIDAPELAQAYVNEARLALSAAVLGRSVTVAFSKLDQYGRTVGAVFTPDCRYVNLDMVAAGAAWYYKAYQCEISASVRAMFTSAQEQASLADRGLWAQPDPEAPWHFRNGTEPAVPVCASDAPSWAAGTALTAAAATVPVNTTTTTPMTSSGVKICYVGPRGGTYTLTASGKKNYGGC